ncbi:MAG: hypothetical protein AB7O66_17565 [Limisphaerales bacterium]
MKAELLRQKLLASARTHPPSDRVPYAFEKRIMSRLRLRETPDAWSAWGSILWRAVAPCFALMLLAGIGSYAVHPTPEDFATQLDAVLLADLDVGGGIP